MKSDHGYLTLLSHMFSQTEEETFIYSAIIFAMMKTDGGTMDAK